MFSFVALFSHLDGSFIGKKILKYTNYSLNRIAWNDIEGYIVCVISVVKRCGDGWILFKSWIDICYTATRNWKHWMPISSWYWTEKCASTIPQAGIEPVGFGPLNEQPTSRPTKYNGCCLSGFCCQILQKVTKTTYTVENPH